MPPEIELRACVQPDAAAVDLDVLRAGLRAQGGELRLVRHAVLPAGKAPGERQGIERRVIGSAGRGGKVQRRLDERGGLFADCLAARVASSQLRLRVLTGEKTLQPVDLLLRRVQRGRSLRAIGAQLHHRVHGEALARRLLFRAAGEQQQRKTQKKQKKETLHKPVPFTDLAARKPGRPHLE